MGGFTPRQPPPLPAPLPSPEVLQHKASCMFMWQQMEAARLKQPGLEPLPPVYSSNLQPPNALQHPPTPPGGRSRSRLPPRFCSAHSLRAAGTDGAARSGPGSLRGGLGAEILGWEGRQGWG